MRGPEYIEPFAAEEDSVLHIDPSTHREGVLELYVASGGPVTLFWGRRTLAQAKDGSDISTPDSIAFDLSAGPGAPARVHIGKGTGELTLYCAQDTVGHLRYTGCACGG